MNIDLDLFKFGSFLAGLVLFLLLESIFAARQWVDRRPRRLAFHLGLSIFNSILLRFPAFIPLLIWVEYVRSLQGGLFGILELSPLIQVIATVIIFDGFNYLWHRLNHRIPFLWRFHKVHHVDTHVDVTTSMRFHPGELAISSVFKALWVLILGPSLETYIIFEAALTLAAQFHHCNIDFPDRTERLIRSVFVTPRFHAAHHTVTKRTGDNNFATILICWDRFFGTCRKPDYEEIKNLGLPSGGETYLSFPKSMTAPFTSGY